MDLLIICTTNSIIHYSLVNIGDKRVITIGLWCLTQLSILCQLNRWGNRSTRRKTTNLLKVTDKLYHVMLYRVHLTTSGIQTHNFSADGNWLHILVVVNPTTIQSRSRRPLLVTRKSMHYRIHCTIKYNYYKDYSVCLDNLFILRNVELFFSLMYLWNLQTTSAPTAKQCCKYS